MDIFKNATKMGSFNNWLTNIPDDDLQHLSALLDLVGQGEDLPAEDQDTYGQLAALVIHFSGMGELTEDQLNDKFMMLTIMLAMEQNVREGKMTREGVYSLVDGEDTARFKMTEKGEKSVKDMIDKLPGKPDAG